MGEQYKKNSNAKGFTLLEVLIALAIFSIGILGMAKAQTSSTFQNVKSRLYTERAADAAGWVEQTLNLDFDNDGTLTPVSYDRYTITKAVTNRVLDPNITSSNIVDTVKRIDVSVQDKKTGNLFFTITYYKAITY